MKRAIWLTAWLALTPAAGHAQGIAVGWDGRAGSTLVGELNCLACHEGSVGSLPTKQAPILADVGARVTPQFLRAYLANPHGVKPGSAMPDLLHGMADGQRIDTVEALTHYLVSLGGPMPQRGLAASQAQVSRGQELFHSVGCVACHAPVTAAPKHKAGPIVDDEDEARPVVEIKKSVPLVDLAMKTTLPALAKFLIDPLHVRPSGRMPSLSLTPNEADAVAAYLLREQISPNEKQSRPGLAAAYFEGSFKNVPDFAKLKPTRQIDVTKIDLADVAPKEDVKKKKKVNAFAARFLGEIEAPRDGNYRFWTASDDGSVLRIDGKVVVDNDGLHSITEKEGVVSLKKGRHSLEVGFFEGSGGFVLSVFWQPPGENTKRPLPPDVLFHESASTLTPKGAIDFTLEPALVERGKALFASLGCASCHATEKAPGPKLKAPALAKLDPSAKGGCLDAAVAAGRPRFAFDAEQRAALQKTIGEWKAAVPAWDAKAVLDHRLNAMSCYACHVRDGKGGPDKQRSNYFGYEVLVDLGDEGRLPPPLSGVGAKLTAEGFDDALHSGQRYRSFMATRMPKFGKDNVGHLPEQFAKADEGRIKEYVPQLNKSMADDGRKLVGRTTLACINCHAWGTHRLPGAEGLDLLQAPRRLKPEWFHAWLSNPNAIRPGTRMPTAWPDGKSYFPSLQAGHVDRQMDAIWAYLRAGNKAGFPAGLGPIDSNLLVPVDEPIVFRTFVDKVSALAILVGFPQRRHVAFDANRVRMAVAWSGDFVSTKGAWEGRGGNYVAIPSVQTVVFPPGPPLARLGSTTDPWPTDLTKKKIGAALAPDGWKFLGYRFDEKRVPTFLYRVGEVDVEETPLVEFRPKGTVLLRRFRFVANEPPSDLFLLAAVGKTITVSDKTYQVDGKVDYRIDGAEPQVRDVAARKELIVPIRFQRDEGRKASVANVTLEIDW